MSAAPIITRAVLLAVAGTRTPQQRQGAIMGAIVEAAPSVLPGYEIHPLARLAHFLGQIAHESDRFRTTEEYASGSAYEGRKKLGNTRPGYGRRYKGRGLLQLTGRYNYALYGGYLGIDLEGEPERAADPVLSLRIAAEYWRRQSLNEAADADDIRLITHRINGGFNGLSDRIALTERASVALAQQRLLGLGFDPGPVDGAWGPMTRRALNTWRARRGLPEVQALSMAGANASPLFAVEEG